MVRVRVDGCARIKIKAQLGLGLDSPIIDGFVRPLTLFIIY